MDTHNVNYLEGRRLVKRWSGPVPAIVSLVLTLAVFYATWWIFQDPRGIMRMYTPYVGYMYTRWWLIVLIWMVYLFNYWPFNRKWVEQTHPLVVVADDTGVVGDLFPERVTGLQSRLRLGVAFLVDVDERHVEMRKALSGEVVVLLLQSQQTGP